MLPWHWGDVGSKFLTINDPNTQLTPALNAFSYTPPTPGAAAIVVPVGSVGVSQASGGYGGGGITLQPPTAVFVSGTVVTVTLTDSGNSGYYETQTYTIP